MDVDQQQEVIRKDQQEEEEKTITTTTTTTTTKGEVEVVAVDWSGLPEHLTSLVLSKLSSITDYARFGAVCAKWRSIFLTDDQHHYTKSLPPQLPLLIIPTPPSHKKKKNKNKYQKKKSDNSSSSTVSCSFYRVTDGKIFNQLQLAMPSDRYVRGSGHGWLITIDSDEICFSVQLMNPFLYPNTSSKEIKLPPLIAHPSEQNDPAYVMYSHLRKAILSADPISNPKDFIVMAIFGEFKRLSFCKPGDETWTPIQDHVKGLFHDVIYFQGKFYAVNQKGTVVVCNVEERTTTTYARPPPPTKLFGFKKYLVVSAAGEFYQVHRHYDEPNTNGFTVFRLLKRRESDNDWVQVKHLSGLVFFVGDNVSISISASDFPGCKANCIYYTDDYIDSYWRGRRGPDGPHDLGLFNLENGSFEKHYPTEPDIHIWPAPIWIEPTLPRSITRSKLNLIIDKKLDDN